MIIYQTVMSEVSVGGLLWLENRGSIRRFIKNQKTIIFDQAAVPP